MIQNSPPTVETKLTAFYEKVFTDLFDPVIEQIYIPEYEFPADKVFNIKNINNKPEIDDKHRQILLNNLAYGHFKYKGDNNKIIYFKEMDNIRKKEAVSFAYDTTKQTANEKLTVQMFDDKDKEPWIYIDKYIEKLLNDFKQENGYEDDQNEPMKEKKEKLTEHYKTLGKIMDKFEYLF